MNDSHAIIDIGSNTVRLVVYGGPPRAPAVLLNEKVTARLGRELSQTGRLPEKGVEVALEALTRFAALVRLMDVRHVDAVATAAVRDAANGPEFLAAVRDLGFEPSLLSGIEEACISALGVISAFPEADGVAGDLGGGSLELTALGGDECEHAVSMPFGTLRLPDLREGGAAQFGATVRKALKNAKFSYGKDLPFFIVGGSWRALARYAMQIRGWPLDDPHGFELTAGEALAVCKPLSRGKVEESVTGISSSRMASLPDAAALLEVLVRQIGPSSVIFSSWGLREGLLYRRLEPSLRRQDPMLAGVSAFAGQFGISPSTATMVAGWTSDISESSNEKLRLAAVMLALASMRNEPNLRAELARRWALGKRWIGLDARGRARLAMAVLANAGECAIPEEFSVLTSEEELHEAVGWGLSTRLCRKLTGCSASAIANTALRREDDRIVLSLREPAQALYGNAVAKDLKLLGEWFGCDYEVETLTADALLD
ncbi:Ppx/GppA family phosphatase [Novosphingobium marinum]|uniref:Exopolyphosphatase/guanosine-5'-triphosphate, 3'-diphosphate pyrophosphatase n=2 Tax=Novosphingobium marinum TaxID=1514948 RepID=A0A7Z0BVC4_9SPHN|nr:Ppx/GppA family phosphatase [Novosphingobium marinum]NYH96138.1 exopolyphosphatase/guanosine-5'-triphosphate,3'-diphosphate pyrophosphatase [Novosphingobium marinum]